MTAATADKSNLFPISPNDISTDLLSPGQQNRITIPSVGHQVLDPPPLGGKTWGENLTNYGGIGKLPFLGITRTRDLLVPRSHRHFKSGFSKYDTSVHAQPCRLTPLVLSASRLNDQVLDPPFQTTIDLEQCRFPNNLPTEPYYSHRSVFELFPRIDETRRDSRGAVLSRNTRDYLHDYYFNLYGQPKYPKLWPDHTTFIKENMANRFAGQDATAPPPNDYRYRDEPIEELLMRIEPELHLFILDIMQKMRNRDASTHFGLQQWSILKDIVFKFYPYNDLKRLRRCLEILYMMAQMGKIDMTCFGPNSNNCPLAEIMAIIDKVDLPHCHKWRELRVLLDRQEERLRANQVDESLRRAAGALRERQELGHRETKVEIPTQEEVAGIWPRWPPSKWYYVGKKLQLEEVLDVSSPEVIYRPPPPSTVYQPRPPSAQNTTSGYDPRKRRLSRRPPSAQRRVQFKNVTEQKYSVEAPQHCMMNVPSVDDRTAVGNSDYSCYTQYLESLLPVKLTEEASPALKGYVAEVKPDQDEDAGRMKPLPPISLASCLHPTGNRIQDRLGLQFKAAAHRRYHASYPEPVPDHPFPIMRDNLKWRKRNTFYGFTAAALRGCYQSRI